MLQAARQGGMSYFFPLSNSRDPIQM
jgi:hypothetical protein